MREKLTETARADGAVVLASGSPRRRELLLQAGLTGFRVEPARVDETMAPDTPPEKMVMQLSRRKAAAVCCRPGELAIGADTIVWLDGQVLGKPDSPERAGEMLARLSGRRHAVYTGVTLLRGLERMTEYEMTEVWFRRLEQREIEAYVRSGEPMDKAGAYAIQGRACCFVTRIEGDYTNVVGLPMARLAAMLRRFGVALLK